MKIKALFCDLDDTLVDTRHLYDSGIDVACDKFNEIANQNFSREKFRDIFLAAREQVKASIPTLAAKHSRAIYFQRIVEDLHIETNFELMYEMTKVYYSHILDNMKIRGDALDLLKSVQESGRKVVLVSDGATELRLEKIHRLQISDYVDFLVSSEESGMEKPAKENFLSALRKANVKSDEVVMLGNNAASDTLGANVLGIISIQLRTNNSKDEPKTKVEEPKYMVDDLSKVSEIINELES